MAIQTDYEKMAPIELDELVDQLKKNPPKRRLGARKIRAKRMPYKELESVNDDANLFHNEGRDVVLGVYGTEEWIFAQHQQQWYKEGLKIVQIDGTWLAGADFDLRKWVEALGHRYMYFAENVLLMFTYEGTIIKMKTERGKIEAEIHGEPQYAEIWQSLFDNAFKKAENLIEWIYNERGDSTSVPLNFRKGLRSAYPWIDSSYASIDDYIDEYIDSPASILILIGAPGTGKTTFIKNMIHRSKANAKVAYDPKVMSQDSFFAGFIADDSRFLIMEDSDEFMQSRADGNTMMHRFLNVSDGLVSAADKKLVFSTNLPNMMDIDEALMRPGRCFDVLQFRALTRDEALSVLAEAGSDRKLPDGNQFTLAEVFASQPSGKGFVRRKIGFRQ